MMEREKLTVSGIKLSTNTDSYYPSIENELCIGDMHIWLSDYSTDLENSTINIIVSF